MLADRVGGPEWCGRGLHGGSPSSLTSGDWTCLPCGPRGVALPCRSLFRYIKHPPSRGALCRWPQSSSSAPSLSPGTAQGATWHVRGAAQGAAGKSRRARGLRNNLSCFSLGREPSRCRPLLVGSCSLAGEVLAEPRLGCASPPRTKCCSQLRTCALLGSQDLDMWRSSTWSAVQKEHPVVLGSSRETRDVLKGPVRDSL